MFELSDKPIDPGKLTRRLADPRGGGFVTFEGWVRNHNEGRDVCSLEYEAYPALCDSEAAMILAEAKEKFDIIGAVCVHRAGSLAIGDIAVWIGVSGVHRGPAFAACQFIIDEIKVRLPIWKKEIYTDGDSGWVNCAHCVVHAHG
jgi:molybdopterin synthase catalytic subunit